MFLFFYHVAWTILILFSLPFLSIRKSQRTLERSGLSIPSGSPGVARKAIWIHALSVGEVVSALPLVRFLKERYPGKKIVFTVSTVQGMEIARNELKREVELLYTMPIDFWWSVRRIVDHLRPSVLILIETDIWPGLIGYLRSKGIRTLLVNGRISARTFRSYHRFRFFTQKMLQPLELCLMQSDVDRDRLLKIGINPERVKTVGNIKFDRAWEPMDGKEYEYWLGVLNLGAEETVWIAGSTHEGEEEVILDVFARLRLIFSPLRLIIAPRRVERTETVYGLSLSKGFKTVRRTELPGIGDPYDVLIFNTIGELDRVYGVAGISFVGGSLVSAGGHNLLEPASFGIPVLFGPHTEDFLIMAEALIENGGGKRVRDGEELFDTMRELLSDPERSGRMGRQAKEFVDMNRGALKRVLDYIAAHIEKKGAGLGN